MTKAKEAPETSTKQPLTYDTRQPQVIPFTLERGGKEYRVTHTLQPLSNERYFQFEFEVEQLVQKAKKVTTGIYTPKQSLWFDLVESVGGYKEKPDWKEKIHQSDAVAAIQALLHAQVLDDAEVEATEGDDLFDMDALTPISFRAMQSGALLLLTHKFKPETKAQTDQFLAIETNEPIPGVLASAEKLSKAEKLYNLGQQLLAECDGYADGSDIPPWHVATTTESFFLRQLGRMGKSLMP